MSPRDAPIIAWSMFGSKGTHQPHQLFVRYPDTYADKALRALQSLVPVLAKCGVLQDVHSKIHLVHRDLQIKHYFRSWWRPLLTALPPKWGIVMLRDLLVNG